ncbi:MULTISPECIES: outer membrane lipid asymmetry maintenance protein MlaD [Methylobacter]|jgi:phospholipid/cholesterol/gamma-HCH transport system substrate-binding protein|uniref:Mammalian cell entry related domain protein n=2 Tax=Methylobacter tundripaludum TaxID=173365 RepID=G3ITL2_METTV|nr:MULTISPECIES: outer membrane lipid asymmetry maintenance protein MlaD [Methylobacter]EGW21422.1 Mammalian cell entry related domain protein [Methylobacter tundripaludum SV96]MDI1278573.1 outer membrane lipid asymmetry maintenance protein MlaD [Methylobacter sp.]MDI1359381.1 outer membrane lipid asymmetry maintenance protein MlaD [Methylobacter sp.]PPK74255.1 phospholipid/cholesterol/gamma-HCH transport system substrate-binding protein [Methylobacter tundripaludum]
MQHTSTQDTLVGLFVAAGIVGLFFLALQVSNLSSFTEQNSYTVTARFENSGGLKVKSPVSAAGVKIGKVSAIHFDPKTYESVVQLSIDSQYNTLPDDTTASVFTAGLLGEQYVNLEAGGSEEHLKDGGKIEITQSAIILEKALGQFLFKSAEEKK